MIVKGQEKQHQVLRDAAGADAVTLVEVTLTFDETTQKQQADLAKDARSKAALLGTWAPLACILLGRDPADRRSGVLRSPGRRSRRRGTRQPLGRDPVAV